MDLQPGETASFDIPVPGELAQAAAAGRVSQRDGPLESLGGGRFRRSIELWLDGEPWGQMFVEYRVPLPWWSQAARAIRSWKGWRLRMFREEEKQRQ
jgi:hypothetical protein